MDKLDWFTVFFNTETLGLLHSTPVTKLIYSVVFELLREESLALFLSVRFLFWETISEPVFPHGCYFRVAFPLHFPELCSWAFSSHVCLSFWVCFWGLSMLNIEKLNATLKRMYFWELAANNKSNFYVVVWFELSSGYLTNEEVSETILVLFCF